MEKFQFKVDTRDRVLRAWENSIELARDFEIYSKQIIDRKDIAKAFSEFAEDEGRHAAKLLEFLEELDKEK